jgi:pilus assembly protein CpaF
MNTGHPGSMGTVHANSAREALSRIESMVAMGATNLPSRMVREQIASAINLIVQVARLRDGSRKVVQVAEVVGMEGDVVTLQDLFVFQQEDDGTGDKVIGSHKATGIRPRFWDEARAWGLEAQLASALGFGEQRS